jgi:hypothetical protein
VAFAIFDYLLKSNAKTVKISHTDIENIVHVKRSAIKNSCGQLVKLAYLKIIRARWGRINSYSLPAISSKHDSGTLRPDSQWQ